MLNSTHIFYLRHMTTARTHTYLYFITCQLHFDRQVHIIMRTYHVITVVISTQNYAYCNSLLQVRDGYGLDPSTIGLGWVEIKNFTIFSPYRPNSTISFTVRSLFMTLQTLQRFLYLRT